MPRFSRLEAHSDEICTIASPLFSSQARFLIVSRLLDGQCSVGELSKALGMQQSSVSQHLSRLRKAGTVQTRREHRQVFYSLSDHGIRSMMIAVDLIYAKKDMDFVTGLLSADP